MELEKWGTAPYKGKAVVKNGELTFMARTATGISEVYGSGTIDANGVLETNVALLTYGSRLALKVTFRENAAEGTWRNDQSRWVRFKRIGKQQP